MPAPSPPPLKGSNTIMSDKKTITISLNPDWEEMTDVLGMLTRDQINGLAENLLDFTDAPHVIWTRDNITDRIEDNDGLPYSVGDIKLIVDQVEESNAWGNLGEPLPQQWRNLDNSIADAVEELERLGQIMRKPTDKEN